MVSDFFLQVEVTVPQDYRPIVIERISMISGDPGWLGERVNAVMPVCGIKWCCILMNEFLPPDGRRRRFAGEETDSAKKSRQLALAKSVLARALEPASQSPSE